MRNRPFLLLLALTLTAAENPTDKGSIILHGNASFTSLGGDIVNMAGEEAAEDTTLGDESVTTINIVPSLGFFISPNLMIGGDLEYIKLSYTDFSGSSFGVGPTVGYYFNMDDTRLDAKGAIYPYVKGFFIWTTTKLENTETDAELLKFTTTTYGAQAGLVFMLSNTVGADFSVRYSKDKYKPDMEDAEDVDSVDGNTLNIGVGITAFIY